MEARDEQEWNMRGREVKEGQGARGRGRKSNMRPSPPSDGRDDLCPSPPTYGLGSQP
jgi:hypothetical protein